MKFNFVDAEKASFGVEMICRELNVSVSGYYAWAARGPSQRTMEDEKLKPLIAEAHVEGRRNYGRPKIHEALKKRGIRISAKRVARLMCEQAIRGKVRRGFVRTTDSNHSLPVFSNLLNRDFTATAPNQRWVCDISVPQKAA